MAVFACDPNTGLLTFIESETDGVGGVNGLFRVNALQVTPDGKHVYAAGTVLSSVVIFARDAATGALTFLGLERDGENGVDGIGAANSHRQPARQP